MSSLPVSVCMISFEIRNTFDNTFDESLGYNSRQYMQMAAKQGSKPMSKREVREYTVETYSHESEKAVPKPLLCNTYTKSEVTSENTDNALKPDLPRDEIIQYVSGNPFVETNKGILHLYKENELTSMEQAASCSYTICILAVPASMTCNDLLTFLAACQGDIKHIRIIRDGSPNQYMVLLTFRSQQSSIDFYTSFNGIPFNSLEPTCCNLVFVSHIESIAEGEVLVTPPLHTELPTCPVCLERMDESVDGILTILCNHSFHGSCLSKWGDTTCPVCRYIQTPELVADNRCLECSSADSLWICLICGHVGCGRYVKGHAFKHYLDTQHCYSMQLENNRVWDYVGDNFVHRLLQNKTDGKLVEGNATEKEENSGKLDSMQLEFTYTLTTQLDSQRMYFEDILNRFEQQSIENTMRMKEELTKSLEENKNLQETITTLKKEKVVSEKKVQQLSARLTQIQSDLAEERQMSKAMQDNQSAWQKQYSELEGKFNSYKYEKDKEINDLKEQLRDIMFYFEAEKQVMASDHRDEIAEGHIVVGESSTKTKHRHKKNTRSSNH